MEKGINEKTAIKKKRKKSLPVGEQKKEKT